MQITILNLFVNSAPVDLQMVNDINVSTSWNSLRCNYQLKHITTPKEKNNAINKNYILKKMALNFKTLGTRETWINKELITFSRWQGKQGSIFSGTASKNKFHLWEIFWSYFTIPGWSSQQTDPIPYNHICCNQPIKQSRMFVMACTHRNLPEKNMINMAAVNMSKFKKINHLCKVVSMLRQNDNFFLQFSFFESSLSNHKK